MTRQPKSRGETRNGRSETLTAHVLDSSVILPQPIPRSKPL